MTPKVKAEILRTELIHHAPNRRPAEAIRDLPAHGAADQPAEAVGAGAPAPPTPVAPEADGAGASREDPSRADESMVPL